MNMIVGTGTGPSMPLPICSTAPLMPVIVSPCVSTSTAP